MNFISKPIFLFFVLFFFSKKVVSQDLSFILIKNKGGQTLGYSPNSGVKILTVDGLSFKDLNKNGTFIYYH